MVFVADDLATWLIGYHKKLSAKFLRSGLPAWGLWSIDEA
jgi:hypothetical protein